MLFLLILLIIFLLQNSAIVFLRFKSLKEWLFFYSLSCVFKHKQDIFLFLNMQNIKSNYYIIFLKLWKIYSFPVICILKRFNFCYCLRIFSLFLENLRQLLQHIESIYYLFLLIGFIAAFFIQSGESINDPPLFGFIL